MLTNPTNEPSERQEFAPASGVDYSQEAPLRNPWVSSRQMRLRDDAVTRFVDSNPDIGPALERLIIDFPTISRDGAVALAYQGVAPSEAMLDTLVREDEKAQQAAKAARWYQSVKTISRNSMIVAEDLYNSAPFMVLPRIGINASQGMSLGDAFDKSVLGTNAYQQTMLERLGFEIDYGDGFIPSQELVAGRDGFWARVKEMIINGEFEGSPEERLVQADQRARMEQIAISGINPNALAVEQWRSTTWSKTRGDLTTTVPYSPGSIAQLWSTPGTRAYTNYSGLIDIGFRIYMEPVDLLFDQAGDVIRLGNRKVMKDLANFGGTTDGANTLRAVLKDDFGVEVLTHRPISGTAELPSDVEVAGLARPVVDETGVRPIEVDVQMTGRAYRRRGQQVADPARPDEWANPTDPYSSPYIDRGVTPTDLQRELRIRGGENAETMLTIEHELVHTEIQSKWWNTVDVDGTKYMDTLNPTKDAPKEIVDVIDGMKADGVTHEALTNLEEQILLIEKEAVSKQMLDAAEITGAEDALKGLTGDGLKKARQRLKTRKAKMKRDAAKAEQEVVNLNARHASLFDELNGRLDDLEAVGERHAVGTAYDNMIDGSWNAPAIMRKFKKRMGLSSKLRPFAGPLQVQDWLTTRSGKRTLGYLAQVDNVEQIRKVAPYLEPTDMMRMADSTDIGEIAEIISSSFNSGKMAGGTRPSVGVIRNTASKGLDGYYATTRFLGGTTAQAAQRFSMNARRWKASTGANILSTTDLRQTLDTIQSFGATSYISRADVDRLQRIAILTGDTTAGIDRIALELEDLSIASLKRQSGDLYTTDQIRKMWTEWRGYEIINRKYWTSSSGNDRPWLWANSKFLQVNDLTGTRLKPEAFMEAQFSVTSRTMPNIRSLRRLHSQQRRTWEVAKRYMARTGTGGPNPQWNPLGFDNSVLMTVGDWTFGIWRDLQLMRAGWAFRIIPEEQIRFSASGYAGMFSNPVDYFISLFNKLEITVPGDDLTLARILKQQEALGAGDLRSLRYPAHMVKGDGWEVASRLDHPEAFWGGLTREFVTSAHDDAVSLVARVGREEALRMMGTPEGQKMMRGIAIDASKEGSLGLVANPSEAAKYIDVIEVRISQITGGDGIWQNPQTGQWLDNFDRPVRRMDEYANKDAVREEIRLLGGEEALMGKSGYTRAQFEGVLEELQGYSIEKLEAQGRVGFVTKPGHPDLVGFIGSKTLDDIALTDEMPFESLREVDKQLEEAFSTREIDPPDMWPVARGELTPPDPGMYRQVTDTFFQWFNAVPSRFLNRQPYFQQVFGAKLADAYYFGDDALRRAFDELMEQNESLRVAFDVGKRKVMKDYGVTSFPTARPRSEIGEADATKSIIGDGFDDVPPMSSYERDIADGKYNKIPLTSDGSADPGYVTEALLDIIEGMGGVRRTGSKSRSIYAYNHARYYTDGEGRVFQDRLFHGSGTYGPDVSSPRSSIQKLEESILGLEDDIDIAVNRMEEINEAIGEADVVFRDSDEVSGLWDTLENVEMGHGVSQEELVLRKEELDSIMYGIAAGEIDIDDYEDVLTELTSGGMSFLFDRAAGYAGREAQSGAIVSIFDRKALGGTAKEWVDEVGDIEQYYSLADQYPVLADIEGLPEAWKKWAGSKAERLKELEQVRIRSHEIATSRGYEFLPDGYLRVTNKLGRTILSPVPLIGGLDAAPKKYREMIADLYEADIAANPDLATMSFVDYYIMLTNPNKKYEIEKVNNFKSLTEHFKVDGVELDAMQSRTLEQMLSGRQWRPEEIILGEEGIMPIAQIPVGVATKMSDFGWTVSANKQVGDTALLIDNFFEDAFFEQTTEYLDEMIATYTIKPLEVDGLVGEEYAVAMDELVTGQGTFSHEWATQVFDYQDMLAKMGSDPLKIYDTGVDSKWLYWGNEGPFFRQDWDQYAFNPKFRGYVEMAAAEANNKSMTLARKTIAGDYPTSGPELTELLEEAWYAEFHRNMVGTGPEMTEAMSGPGETYSSVQHFQELASAGTITSQDVGHLLDNTKRLYEELLQSVDLYKQFDEEFTLQMALVASPDDALSILPGKKFKADKLDELRKLHDEARRGELSLDFSGVPQDVRTAAIEKQYGDTFGMQMNKLETGGPGAFANSPAPVVDDLEAILQSAKYDAIDETKDLFYDLSNKSNIADAMKFIFPFGDAWYEVLSRWAKLMNPVQSGGQSFRNVRRTQVAIAGSQSSGFMTENEYGESVFQWSFAPGMFANSFIPNSTNVQLQGQMPVASLMFIDPTAKGVGAPGVSPGMQLTGRLMAPVTDSIPLFSEALDWLTYGDRSQYRPGDIEEVSDVSQAVSPTVINRLVAAVFAEENRERLGNTKMRLFQSLGISGDPNYNLLDPVGARRAWDVADTAGSWLGWLQILDSWWLPGQPQYSIDFKNDPMKLTQQEMIAETAKLTYEEQLPLITVMRMVSEYRTAREVFNDAEADLYMLERYGMVPSVLQSTSAGIVQSPVTWGGVEWVAENEFLEEIAPFTLVATVPPDADETFSPAAWNGLFSKVLTLDGVDGQPVRVKRSALEIQQAVVRGAGYDQLSFVQYQYDKAVELARRQYGESYSSNDGYRQVKLELDRIKRSNTEKIIAEFPLVGGQQRGRIVGSRTAATNVNYMNEVIKLGTPGTPEHAQFASELPQLAEVAETYASLFDQLAQLSRYQDRGKATSSWWISGESEAAQLLREAVARNVEKYYGSLTDPHQRSYAKWLNEYMMDPFLEEWEWMDNKFSPQLESFPSLRLPDTIPVGGP